MPVMGQQFNEGDRAQLSASQLKRLKALCLRENTPVDDYTDEYGLWVKREDLSCREPGPPFSKTRGVFAHMAKQDAHTIGVLDPEEIGMRTCSTPSTSLSSRRTSRAVSSTDSSSLRALGIM